MRSNGGLFVAAMVLCAAPIRVDAQNLETFDVVSIKPNTSGEAGGSSRAQPGRYQGVNVTLMRVIGLAYRPIQEFEGGPDWIRTDRFDIEAKADGTPTQEQMLRMLRALLADRFGLVARPEARPKPVYALVLARRDGQLGPGLRASDAACQSGPGTCPVRMQDGALTSMGLTMPRLASELSFVGRPVVDRTGLTGAFEVDLRWSPEAEPGGATPDAPSIFTAVQEQLGLKLEPSTGPVDVLVIDRAMKPAAN